MANLDNNHRNVLIISCYKPQSKQTNRFRENGKTSTKTRLGFTVCKKGILEAIKGFHLTSHIEPCENGGYFRFAFAEKNRA